MDSQTRLRRFQDTLPRGNDAEPRLFTAGSTVPLPRNVGLAAVGFEGGIANAQNGWACAVLPDPAQDLCDGWTRQKRVVVVPGLATPAHAVVFHDGSTLLGERHGRTLRLYPGVVWLRGKAHGWRFAAHMGGSDGPATIQLQRSDDPSPIVLTHADLHASVFAPPHPADPAAWWTWALRADVDRFHPIFADLGPDAHVPAPGEGIAARPAYPTFLPRPGLDAAGQAAARLVAEDTAQWIQNAVAPQFDDRWTVHHVVSKGPEGWIVSWTRGFQSRAFQALVPPFRLATLFPTILTQRLAEVCTWDLGLHHIAQRTSALKHRFSTPIEGRGPRGTLSAHATLALQARLGHPDATHQAAWAALVQATK